jgi:hypothetical protein
LLFPSTDALILLFTSVSTMPDAESTRAIVEHGSVQACHATAHGQQIELPAHPVRAVTRTAAPWTISRRRIFLDPHEFTNA